MICANCIHYESCLSWIKHGSMLYVDFDYSVENCPYFEDKSKFIELPCKVGDVIYKVSRGCETNCSLEFECPNCKVPYEIYECEATQEILYWIVFNYDVYDTWYFVTKAEAEARLKELEDKQK